jgi:hypothetical protein
MKEREKIFHNIMKIQKIWNRKKKHKYALYLLKYKWKINFLIQKKKIYIIFLVCAMTLEKKKGGSFLVLVFRFQIRKGMCGLTINKRKMRK